jgi:hypothetical protein
MMRSNRIIRYNRHLLFHTGGAPTLLDEKLRYQSAFFRAAFLPRPARAIIARSFPVG